MEEVKKVDARAIVEFFGHTKITGRISEAVIGVKGEDQEGMSL